MVVDVRSYDALQAALEQLCTFLREQGISSDCIFDSKLVACELLGNVLRHSKCAARLQGEIKDGFLELKILSEEIFPIAEYNACADILSEHGRGLFLVREVCKQYIFNEEDGVRVCIKIQ